MNKIRVENKRIKKDSDQEDPNECKVKRSTSSSPVKQQSQMQTDPSEETKDTPAAK